MKRCIAIVFLLYSLKSFSQTSGFHFVFDYGFVDLSIPCRDLTEDAYSVDRAKFKIKQIIKLYGGKSPDSLYLTDKAYFHRLLKEGSLNHSRLSYKEIYNYDAEGMLMSFHVYPVCNYLTRQDSFLLDNFSVDLIRGNDTVITVKHLRGKLHQTDTYIKGKLAVSANYSQYIENLWDSVSKKYIAGKLIEETLTDRYNYDKDGKLKIKVHINTMKPFNDTVFYNYTNENIRIATKKCYEEADSRYEIYQNTEVSDSKGRIVKSTFFNIKDPGFRESYKLDYDKYGNLVTIKGEHDYWKNKSIYNWYTYKHTYSGKRLLRSVVHYHFNAVENDTEYYFSESGLIESIIYKTSGYKLKFEYQFYN